MDIADSLVLLDYTQPRSFAYVTLAIGVEEVIPFHLEPDPHDIHWRQFRTNICITSSGTGRAQKTSRLPEPMTLAMLSALIFRSFATFSV